MMRNYVSINAKYYKGKEITRIHKHNERISKVDYLLPENLIKYKNQVEDYSNDFEGNLLNTFKQSMIRKEKIKTGRNPTSENDNELVEMVIGLSREQAIHYLEIEGEAGLFRGLKQCMEDIKSAYGFEPLGLTLHLDEGHIDKESGEANLNIHAHAVFHNFDINTKKTVLRNLRKQDWRDMQDLVANSFQKQGLDFIRGEAKADNSKDHQKRNDYIIKKQMDEMKLKNQELSEKIKELNEAKNEIKELRSLHLRESQEYKDLTLSLKAGREEEQEARAERRKLLNDIKKIQEIKENIKEEQNKIIEHQKERISKLKAVSLESLNNDIMNDLIQENEDLKNQINERDNLLNLKDKLLGSKNERIEELINLNHEQSEIIESLEPEKTNKRRMR